MKTTTICELTVLAKLTADQLAELKPMVEALTPSDPNAGEALADNDMVRFESVFEGDMPPDMLRWFSAHKVPFLWAWGAYEDTGAGANFFDPELNEVFIIRTHENLVVMPLIEALDQQKVFHLQGITNILGGYRAELARAAKKIPS